jgi:hypothetical protein
MEEYIEGKQFKVDVNKIETIEDIKRIMVCMDLHYTSNNKEDYDGVKHLLKDRVKMKKDDDS